MKFEVNNREVFWGLIIVMVLLNLLLGFFFFFVDDFLSFFFMLLILLSVNTYFFFVLLQHGVGNIYSIVIKDNYLRYISIYRNIEITNEDIKAIKFKKIKYHMGSYVIVIIKLKKRLPICISTQELNKKDEYQLIKKFETYFK